MSSSKKIYFYPVWLRVWHGVNALGIIVLIISGLSMQSSNVSSAFGFNLIINIHNIAGVFVSLGFIGFFFVNLVTKNGKYYLLKRKGFFSRPVKQAKYYMWGMFKGEKPHFPLSEKRKFNPLQKLFYVLVMYLVMPIVIISGFALLFPEIITAEIYGMSGVFITALTHSAMGFFISIFLVIHLYVATIGESPTANFRSIINGWHQAH